MSSSAGHSALSPVRPGERLAGRYVVERVVGTGGMGVVVAARHEQLGRTVAIKILTAPGDVQPEAVDRFLREARAAASLRSEHIARVMDAGTDERGRHFIVMEYLDGEDLASVIRRGESLSIAQAVGYILHACEALAEAHGQGIIHRDLKPENIFLTRRVDGSPFIKVLDFGISKMTDLGGGGGSLAISGPRSLLGSPLYMSPEQIRTPGSVDQRSDVWALGVILFELLAGRRPFDARSLPEILAAVLKDSPPALRSLRPDVPQRLSDVVGQCLQKPVDLRIPSAGALAQALHGWAPRWARDSSNRATRVAGITTQATIAVALEEMPLGDAAHPAGSAPQPVPKRGGLLLPVLAAMVACGLLSLGWWRLQSHSGSKDAPPLPPPSTAAAAPAPKMEISPVDPAAGAAPIPLAAPSSTPASAAPTALDVPPLPLARSPSSRERSAHKRARRSPRATPVAAEKKTAPLDPLEGRK